MTSYVFHSRSGYEFCNTKEQRIRDWRAGGISTLRTLLAEIALKKSICQKGNTLVDIILLFFLIIERCPPSGFGVAIGEGKRIKLRKIFLPVSMNIKVC